MTTMDADLNGLADEIDKWPDGVGTVFAPDAKRVIPLALRLVVAVDQMMAPLGAYGTIRSDDDRVAAVMNILQEIDPQ